jgi:hypothetical protein
MTETRLLMAKGQAKAIHIQKFSSIHNKFRALKEFLMSRVFLALCEI